MLDKECTSVEEIMPKFCVYLSLKIGTFTEKGSDNTWGKEGFFNAYYKNQFSDTFPFTFTVSTDGFSFHNDIK
jgi:hypothetical protein